LIRAIGSEKFAVGEHAMESSVDLGRQLEEVIADRVKTGRYGSRTDVLREGVRLVQEREARLAALDAAIASGLADADAERVTPMDEVFGRLQAKYEKQSKAKA
jgi:antitoxin ParD1/3/4